MPAAAATSASEELCSAPAAGGEASERRHRGWEVNLGALAFGSEGVALKPQMLFGAQLGNFSAEAGLHDVRNGLKVSAQAEAAMSVEATGFSVAELHDSIQFDTPGFSDALDAAKRFMSNQADNLTGIAQTLGMGKERLEGILAGKVTSAKCTPMTLKVTAEVGVGLSAHVCLGWRDTQGFNMVGAGGKASAALSLSVSAFAGRHRKKRCAKILLGITNFKFEYVFPIGTLEGQCIQCNGSGKSNGGGLLGLGKARCDRCGGTGKVLVAADGTAEQDAASESSDDGRAGAGAGASA